MRHSLFHRHFGLPLLALFVSLRLLAPAGATEASVKVWEEPITIPTYLAGDPEPNPMFYFGRDSQGAEGRVYPYPLYDTLTDKKVDKTYNIVYLENEYVRIGIAARRSAAGSSRRVDKTNDYNFIYRQHVIKPALIGLIGAWISGGIEWNIPHHHRATHVPARAIPHRGERRRQQDDLGGRTGSAPPHALGRGLHAAARQVLPGSSVRILNRTPVVNTMLCFANVAVHVNENYQVIFPPSTQCVTYHGKREFTNWPIANARLQRRRFHRRRGRELVQEPHLRQLDVRLELRGRFLRRLRPRQAGRH